MDEIRKRVRSQSGFGAVVLALMDGGRPYDIPPPKKDVGNPVSKLDQGKGVFAQSVAISHTETAPKQSQLSQGRCRLAM